jgi:hypothetical protein
MSRTTNDVWEHEAIVLHVPATERPALHDLIAIRTFPAGTVTLQDGTSFTPIFGGSIVAKEAPDGGMSYWSDGRRV